MELLLILVPLGMAVLGIAMIANAVETIRKAREEWKR